MLTAVVTRGAQIEVSFVSSATEAEHEDTHDCEFQPNAEEGETTCGEGPNPIMPELKELAWGAGSFVVFAILMRFYLFPRLKRGMDARYSLIQSGHEQADAARAAAKAEVAEYEAALATVKAEAHARIEAARTTVEGERQERLAVVNAEIAAKRDAAAEAAQATRQAARPEVAAAATAVAAHTIELSTGRPADADAVRAAVDEAMGAGVAS